MNSCIAVTGGAGFIGSHLVRRLVDQGYQVRVAERLGAPVGHLPLDRIDVVRADIRDRAAVDQTLRNCRDVYHLAANANLWAHQRGTLPSLAELGLRPRPVQESLRDVVNWFHAMRWI
jgi:dihydroflavonol-4-reductase